MSAIGLGMMILLQLKCKEKENVRKIRESGLLYLRGLKNAGHGWQYWVGGGVKVWCNGVGIR